MITAMLFGLLFGAGAALCVGNKRYGWATWFGMCALAEFIIMGAAVVKC